MLRVLLCVLCMITAGPATAFMVTREQPLEQPVEGIVTILNGDAGALVHDAQGNQLGYYQLSFWRLTDDQSPATLLFYCEAEEERLVAQAVPESTLPKILLVEFTVGRYCIAPDTVGQLDDTDWYYTQHVTGTEGPMPNWLGLLLVVGVVFLASGVKYWRDSRRPVQSHS